MTNTKKIILTECPRDAMQGLKNFIPTRDKIRYINDLLKVGFDVIDFGSFVSHSAVPQMSDTSEVLKHLDFKNSTSKLLSIIANVRGAKEACAFDEIHYLGFPFSISETFQKRNTNSTISASLENVKEIYKLCNHHNKELVVYLSMAFGNPYGDEWNKDIAIKWTQQIVKEGIRIISLADTIGVSNPENIAYLFSNLIKEFPDVSFGAHLHTRPESWEEKVIAAIENGCRRFDSAMFGFGGCPMAADHLVGNMPTEKLISYLTEKNYSGNIDQKAFFAAQKTASRIFIG